MAATTLFQPSKLGASELNHRVVMAPLSRQRATNDHVPTELMRQYYEQRATEGGLIISESTLISATAGGPPNVPGIYTEEQIAGWKSITTTVHNKGGIIYNQIVHKGRIAASKFLLNNQQPVSASAIAIRGKNTATGEDYEVPHALTKGEITEIIHEFVAAAKNSMKAGFDGVELQGANGHLIDQFTESGTNKRTDEYGGSIENRARFALEVVDAVSKAIGEDRTAIRFTPFDHHQDMHDDSPYETWGYIIDQLKIRHPNLSYLHMVEPRVNITIDGHQPTDDSLDMFRSKWNKGVFISAGGYTYSPEQAADVANKTGNLIAFGRAFTSNPDLVERLRNGYPLTKYDRPTFRGSSPPEKGYIDFENYSSSP
ncbi:hypothetical protein BDA99DRAFT_535322 [Phascolomyces articulosus]|uniref:NADH:flavin oxidoreductase/NADH oxidase N-terminal domain-containing protein n=1 Tax=Phascolomyces articulosus TaxID=60185 RepID=A0AAD5K506_9FUNG|nr:hypothetical protein BDA99DRAFT_535322 [Phascolomyces articulosus]